jgi:uncharacterized membrane protein YfcA
VLVHFKKAGVANVVLLITSVVVMFALFLYTQIETRRAHRKIAQTAREGKDFGREMQTSSLPRFFQSIPLQPIVRCRTARVVVSMWVIVLVGLVTGFLAGFLGVGGGFIRVPALVYLVGASTHIAVGTDLVEIVFSGGYGALRHSMEGHVDMMAVVVMLSGALFGAQFGSIATAYVRGPAIRYILSYSLILATAGSLMRLAYVLSGQDIAWLSFGAVLLTLGEMIFLCLFIISLVWFAVRHRRGRWVPDWVKPLVIT